ncbi:uncharacterized protein [Centruroides vittatus]|uniref:uncharacterized protein isoform X1 n=2 Tax=Centruroides vittatus TaxID=120091 RepID=UPI00350F41CD
MSLRRKNIQKLTDSPKWTKIRGVFQSREDESENLYDETQKTKKNFGEVCNISKHLQNSNTSLAVKENSTSESSGKDLQFSFNEILREDYKVTSKFATKSSSSSEKHKEKPDAKTSSVNSALYNTKICIHPELNEKCTVVNRKYNQEQNVIIRKKLFENTSRNNSYRQHKRSKHYSQPRFSFQDRKRNLHKFSSVRNLVCKYEQMEKESRKKYLDNNKELFKQDPNRLSILSCQKLCKNRDDSGISEGEESLTSPLHITRFINSENERQSIENIIYNRLVYSNLNFNNREIKKSKSPKPRFVVVKKPMPLPRSPIKHYVNLSECYTEHMLSKEQEAIKEDENIKVTQSEEEWADISEDEKDGNAENNYRISNKSGKRCYQESGNLYDCCSPRRIQRIWKNYRLKDDNGTDSSWETCGDDNSSTTSSEHHYEDLNDFSMDEPFQCKNEPKSPNDFIEESFHFLGNHSADESDNADSLSPCSPIQIEKKNEDNSPVSSRHSITESALIYQDFNALRSSYKKTLKSIKKANILEVNMLKKQTIKNKEKNTNFYVSQCEKPKSYECILEQLDEQKCKKKKKKNYFTLPYQKNKKNSEAISKDDGNITHQRRASDCGPLTEQFSKFVSEIQLDKKSSELHASTINLPERTRASIVSCNSCGDGYVCRNHLEMLQSPLSSSEESVRLFERSKTFNFRNRSSSAESEHNYLQINISENKKSSYGETSGSSQEDIYCSTYDYNLKKSNPYCEFYNSEGLHSLKPQLNIAELAYIVESGNKKLWSDLPEVQASGILEKMSAQQLKLQEALLSVALSEATYLRLLETGQEHFVRSTNSDDNGLCKILSWHEWNVLFSDISPVINVSKRLVADLESRWEESFLSFDIMDILYEHITNYFDAYIKYCSNKLYRDRMLKVLINTKPKFLEVTKNLECSFPYQYFTLQEFLTLPEQHISNLLNLIEEVFHWLPQNSTKYNLYKLTITALRKIISECIEGAQKMERMEEMLLLAHQLDFKECKAIPLISASRWLLKRGEMLQFSCDSPVKKTFGKSTRWNKFPLHVFLFNDLLVLTKRRSEDNYLVLDYCPKDMVQVKSGSQSTIRLPTGCKNPIQLILLSNQENKTVEMILSCYSESEKLRWKEILTFSEKPKEQEQIQKRDFQVQCIRSYNAQQCDELCLNEGEIINVIRKMNDGWCKGERVRDNVIGWFPTANTTKLDMKSNHLLVRNKTSLPFLSSFKTPISPK